MEALEFSTLNNKNKRISMALEYIEKNYNEAEMLARGNIAHHVENVSKPAKKSGNPIYCRGIGIN